ncbi:MAG: hypothetical protein A4E71_00127 [Smithella sp. PtaU1.Bin162]|nr:MAG: hypothetical protein A4E71_00127 [Smithella sp. PtaU1.Bin162]
MVKINSLKSESGNAYILFGFEAIQARPNLDPYTSTLRTNDETMQVFTSDVHLKHHVRRGIKAYATEKNIAKPEATIFYEKEDEAGNSLDFATRLKLVRAAYSIDSKGEDKKDAFVRCLDLPLFGYVHAIKGENFNVTNSANTLFRPITFHTCEIYSLGRNNAFPTEKEGKTQESAGSATVDSLEYGFFLALWEINLNMLKINASEHKVVAWEKEGYAGWLDILINGMWKAYSTDRYPSFTQRSQFAQFVVGWKPEGELSYENPADLISKLDKKKITSHAEAITALNSILPNYLNGWGANEGNIFASHMAGNCNVNLR